MIPENIDLKQLASDLDEDAVAMGQYTGEQFPTLEKDLINTVSDAQALDFGSLGVVVLDDTPVPTSNLRDIAQELLNETDIDTVIVRAPASAAVVSDVHSRASLEAGQHELLSTTDYVLGTELLVRDVTESGVGNIEWGQSLIWGLVTLLVVVVIVAASVRRKAISV
ncbi:hypothetical protein N24_1630 [Corynebacterium suranareeae]|uniref:1-deoxy-D-xylulose-5-phosphate synthase n=1 Tax=Corynebacterium suranareeae TaxID=2506452 RepID=A0A169RWX6_9CORY|nr:DUF6676 family protein [Corynebacterium suranareeae]BAU95892.1 hypothetical protein N24_1630 [Corynebacterium suranareeae]